MWQLLRSDSLAEFLADIDNDGNDSSQTIGKMDYRLLRVSMQELNRVRVLLSARNTGGGCLESDMSSR